MVKIETLDQYQWLLLEKDLLQHRMKKCNSQLEEIEQFILSCDDTLKQIVSMRFLENRKWIDISMSLGSSNESYSRNLLNRYLKNYYGK